MLNKADILKGYRPHNLPNPIRLAKLGKVIRKYFLTVAAIVTSTTATMAIYTFSQPFLYESTAAFLIENTNPNNTDNNLATQINVLTSTPVIESAIAKLEVSDISQPELTKQISENLVVAQAPDARVLNISYRDRSAQTAKAIVEALLKTYKAYGATKASESTKIIQTQIPQVKQQLQIASSNLTKFRQKYNITDPDSYAAAIYNMRQGLETQIQDLQIKMAQTQKLQQELQRQVGKPADVALGSAILSQDPTYQTLVKQFQEIQTKYVLELTRFQESYPTVQALRDRRDQIYKLMQAQASVILGGRALEAGIGITEGTSTIKQNLATQLFETQTQIALQSAELASLQAAQTRVAQIFAEIPQLQQTYVELQRQSSLASSSLTKLSEKLAELRLIEAKERTSWQILTSPYASDRPISPNVGLNLLVGALTGLTLGILLAMILERSDDRLKEVFQLQGGNLPILGAVPYLAINSAVLMPSMELVSDRAFLPPRHTDLAFKESINALALSLLHLAIQKPLRTIAFTSSIPAEGKSTLIYNLSLVLAELGHKVLLVDGDMRKPTIHGLAGIKNNLGLSQAIATKMPWQQIVHTGDDQQFADGELHIMTAGGAPANPMILLESVKMTKLLEEWQENYDYVLIDTPPIVGVTDAQSLAPKMDGVVLVTAIEKATKSAIARAMELLHINHCQITGILVNLVDRNDSTYYYDYSTSDTYNYQVNYQVNQQHQPLLSAATNDTDLDSDRKG